jgi:glycosyltransferase involved in cell wall biosynthesis
LPRLQQRNLDVHVLAVGRDPPAYNAAKNIHYTGSVDQVAGYLKAADLAVVPLQQGGGTRMKILDYFACGVPVISTRKGIEGIQVENGVAALIEDDWEQMAEQIASLLTDPRAAGKVAAAAKLWVEKLDWTALAGDYVNLYQR